MNKLVNLLNEYKGGVCDYFEIGKNGNLIRETEKGYYSCGMSDNYVEEVEYSDSIIISKQFGFIERLVENDKIEREKINIEKSDDKRYDEGIVLASNYDNDTYVVEKYYSYTEQLLMILSIQDSPLEYLCSILK